MPKKVNFNRIIVLAFFIVFVIMTSSFNAKASTQRNREQIELDTYFPLKDGMKKILRIKSIITSGTEVVQSSDTGTIKEEIYLPMQEIKGEKVFPVKITQSGNFGVKFSITYYAKDQEGIYVAGIQAIKDNNAKDIIFTPNKHYILKKPLKIGCEWLDEEESQLKRGTKLKMKNIIDIGDTISTPAGTFNECIKLSRSGSIILKSGTEIKKEFKAWLAPGVGLVKNTHNEIKTEMGKTTMFNLETQLESFNK